MRRNVIAQASELCEDLAPLQGHPNPVDRVQSLVEGDHLAMLGRQVEACAEQRLDLAACAEKIGELGIAPGELFVVGDWRDFCCRRLASGNTASSRG